MPRQATPAPSETSAGALDPAASDPAVARAERMNLHERVQSFVRDCLAGRAPAESFDALGLALARYQARYIEPYARLLSACRVDVASVTTLEQLPSVPTEAFRLARIAAHPALEDRAVFLTSGTTAGGDQSRGKHALSTTDTYDVAALGWGAWGLFPDAPRPLCAIVLGPWDCSTSALVRPGDSSLGYMIRRFVERFASEVRVIIEQESSAGSAAGAAIDPAGSAASAGAVDAAALWEACERARRAEVPVALLGTSFAFVHLLDAVGGQHIALPAGSRVMHTGGYKGRSREVEPSELRRAIGRTFGLAEDVVVGEYGMTELSSQLYEGCLRRHLGLPAPSERHGVFCPPPWMRVVAVDPVSLLPVARGSEGLLRIEDLANVDSAVVVQTADRGRVLEGGGVELLGRATGAPPRGCSLAADELLSGGTGAGWDPAHH